MPARLGLSPLSKALSMRWALNINPLQSALALAISLQVAGYAQAQEIELNIPAQSLGSALQEFGRQTNVQVLYSPSDVQGKNSTAVKGKMEPGKAIDTLLGGTGTTHSLNGNSLTVSAVGTAGGLELSPTQVTGNMLGNVTEDSGSYTPGTIATATRLTLTPRQTPQSITVITRQHMEDFGLNNVDDVMRHTPGITVSAYDTERTNYYSRGFSVDSFQYDGIPSAVRNVGYSAGNTLSDMAIYDRVEVLKGATGLLNGAGSLGATINLIRKKPTSQFKGHVELGAGSWDNYRSEVDVSGPLTDSGNIRGRAVAAYQDKKSFMDHYSRKTETYYGITEFDLSPDTMLTLGFDYQDNTPKGSSWSGSFPLVNSNGSINKMPRSYNNGADWSSWQQNTRTAFAMLEHDMGDGWVTKFQLDHKINSYHADLASIQFVQPAADGTAEINAQKYTGETKSTTADLYATGPFSLFGRDHELVVGGSIGTSRWQGKGYWSPEWPGGNKVDFYNWNGNIGKPIYGPPQQYTDDTIRQTGYYVTTRLNVMDDLNVILGGRVANYHLTGNNPSYKETGRFIPYAGVIYDLNENFSAYASYTDIFKPQESYNKDRNQKLLDPDEGQNYEVGLKGEFFGGRLNTSIAYFEVHESNRPISDDAWNNQNPTPPNYAYKGSKAITKGYEAEISGELSPGWQVQGGYTHKVVRDDDDKKISTFEPENQVNLNTTYKLKGDLDKFTIGGGVRWQSKAWNEIYNQPLDRNQDITQKSYWLVDLMTRYQVTKNLSATVNFNNIFDKSYYTNVGFYNSAIYGEPRNVMVTTRWDF